MIDLQRCIKIGTIAKTHSIKGQVILRLKHPCLRNIKHLESVFIEIDGLPVPFFISGYSQRNNEELILMIDDINTEHKARDLVMCDVWLHSDHIGDLALDPALRNLSLTGYEVVDVNLGSLGILEEILEFDQNPLLKIIHNKKEILIPLQSDIICEVDDAAKKILVNTPGGLVDLN